MGLDIYSWLVLGVKAEKKEIQNKITKYDENTGDSYIKDIIEEVYFIKDTDIIIDEENLPDEYIHFTDCYKKKDIFIGIEISITGSNRDLEPNWKEVIPVNNEDLERFNNFLIDLKFEGSIKTYLLTKYSY